MKKVLKNIKETEQFARSFLEKIKPKEKRATVIALSGDLGSGKTFFVKMAARYFGIQEEITSPTFVLMKFYRLKTSNFQLLTHIDAYRLKTGEELLKLGWEELLHNPRNIVFIEWPENVQDAVPEDAIRLKFSFVDESTREIEYYS